MGSGIYFDFVPSSISCAYRQPSNFHNLEAKDLESVSKCPITRSKPVEHQPDHGDFDQSGGEGCEAPVIGRSEIRRRRR